MTGGKTMATKQITTWDEFKTALTETITENTTYEIMNDIDVSDEVISSTITCYMPSTSLRKIFNGNEHKINGLTSYSSVYFFTTTIGITFNDIHFSNMMNQNGGFMRQYGSHSSSDPYCVFNRCFFSGLIKYFATYITFQNSFVCNFNSCSFNLKCDIFQNATYLLQFSNCYIILNPISQYCILTVSGGRRANFNATNCYIGGLLASTWTSSEYLISEHLGSNNVFNCTFKIYNYSVSTTYWFTGSNVVTLVNNEKFVDQNGSSITPTIGQLTNIHLLTDSQLKSRTYIQENTNFPLYG